ncbi:type IV toxin-antitoxin system AbiEi family antitoxin [Rhabdochlamydiaceae symbiont of Dictyostelium giganteum]|uniref:type IV toxin-antitoxin system AbiEi family antitoxin domain-containing protein n=1 Tax=Rhabdochlamydiaceae symbiont of Dictyostelium giganteum TaxID=3342349 RepID=UPI00384D6425
MFAKYLEKLQSRGKRCFTSQEIMHDLNLSSTATRAGLYRLKKGGKLISPVSGLYVIVPPECKPYGSIPAEELIPLMMKHLQAKYYVALLSAAGFYGASHQKPMVFQVVTSQRIKHSLKFGRIYIQLIYKKSLDLFPVQDFIVSSGYLKVAKPELIALDLLKFPRYAGGMNNTATVLSELIESIHVHKLIEVAENLGEKYQLQRLGYLIEKIEVMDDTIKKPILDVLSHYVSSHNLSYIPLASYISKIGHPRCQKWKIIENIHFESDL